MPSSAAAKINIPADDESVDIQEEMIDIKALCEKTQKKLDRVKDRVDSNRARIRRIIVEAEG